ncbi:hypothetical protein L0F63_007115, partial [Massospora cicadina]
EEATTRQKTPTATNSVPHPTYGPHVECAFARKEASQFAPHNQRLKFEENMRVKRMPRLNEGGNMHGFFKRFEFAVKEVSDRCK